MPAYLFIEVYAVFNVVVTSAIDVAGLMVVRQNEWSDASSFCCRVRHGEMWGNSAASNFCDGSGRCQVPRSSTKMLEEAGEVVKRVLIYRARREG